MNKRLDPRREAIASYQLSEYYNHLDADPTFFAREILGIELWGRGDKWGTTGPGQIQVAESVRKNKATLVTGCNGSGKSTLFSILAMEFVQRPGRVMLIAGSEEQLEQTTWPKFREFYEDNEERIPVRGKMHERSLVIAPNWDVQCVVTKEKSRLTGRHPERLLIIADEGIILEDPFFFAVRTMLQGGGCRVAVGLNPDRKDCAAYKRAYKNPRTWHSIALSALDHPNIKLGREVMNGGPTVEWLQEFIDDGYGPSTPEYSSAVLGVFSEAAEGEEKVITQQLLERCAELVFPDSIFEGMAEEETGDIGLDLGRGRDPSTLVYVKKNVVQKVLNNRCPDTMQVLGWAMNVANELGVPASRVHVDSIGMGGPVVDRAYEAGWDIDPVNFAESEQDDWLELLGPHRKFGRRRAQLYFVARELLANKMICIPREFRGIWEDLTEPKVKYMSSGRINIEEKEEIRKRLKRSPNEGDAFVLSLSRANTASFGALKC